MFCQHCGNEIADGAKFCGKCGKSTQIASDLKVSNNGNVKEQQKIKQPKKKNTGKVAIIFAILLLIGVGVSCGIYFTSDSYQCKRNMRLAEESLEAGEPDKAFEYGKTVLELDNTFVEAYIIHADLYQMENNYEAAIQILKEGIEINGGDEASKTSLVAKLAEVYEKFIDSYVDSEDYERAYELVKSAISDTKYAVFSDKQKEIYEQELNYYINNQQYEQAYICVENAIADTGLEVFSDIKVEIYAQETNKYINAGEYAQALEIVNRGIDATGAEALKEQKIQVYRTVSDSHLKAGKYIMAVQMLVDGVQDTGSAILADRESYLREHIAIVKKNIYVAEGQHLEETYEYDTAGNEIKHVFYNYDGIIYRRTECEYDSAGNRIKYISYKANGSIEQLIEYEYDSVGNRIKYIDYKADGSIDSWCEYEYDGDFIKQIVYSLDGSIERWYEYGCDSAGNQVVKVCYNSNGSISSWYQYEYDSAGNQVKYINRGTDGNIHSWCEYEYLTGKLDKEIWYAWDGSISEWYEYEYDILGNVISQRRCSPAGFSHEENRTEYIYRYTGEL